jgi:hypothetical protein
MPYLGIFERDVEIFFLEVDLPDIAVFVSDPKFEKGLVGVGPIRLTHGISCKCPCCFLVSLWDAKSASSITTAMCLLMGVVLRVLDSHSREILPLSGHYRVTRGGTPLASWRWGILAAAARVIHLETRTVLGKGIAVPHQ